MLRCLLSREMRIFHCIWNLTSWKQDGGHDLRDLRYSVENPNLEIFWVVDFESLTKFEIQNGGNKMAAMLRKTDSISFQI